MCLMMLAAVAYADATVAATVAAGGAAVAVTKILVVLKVLLAGVVGKWAVDHVKNWLGAALAPFKIELNATSVRLLAVVVAYPVVLLLNRMTGTTFSPDEFATFIETLLAGGAAIAVYHTQPQVNQ
jgi:hypothetical protein